MYEQYKRNEEYKRIFSLLSPSGRYEGHHRFTKIRKFFALAVTDETKTNQVLMECSICHEDCFPGQATKCNHNFHWTCLKEWLDTKNECPNCRFVNPCNYVSKPKPMDGDDDFMVMVMIATFRSQPPTIRKSEADKAADPQNYVLNPATGRYVKRR